MRTTLVTLNELQTFNKDIQYTAELLCFVKEKDNGDPEFQGYVFKIKK